MRGKNHPNARAWAFKSNGQRLAAAMLTASLLWVEGATSMQQPPAGEELAGHIEFVNRFHAVRNIRLGERRQPVVVIDKAPEGHTQVHTLQRWRRNDFPEDAKFAASDLVIFRAGPMKSTGILVDEPADPGAVSSHQMWLPALRKIRRLSEPDPRERWSGSGFTLGDIYSRRPQDERYEVLGTETFAGCLGSLEVDAASHRHAAGAPSPDCSVDGRLVYRVAAVPVGRAQGYERRVIWVDAETFADYRSEFYVGDTLVKTLDKSWRSMQLDDPRAQVWRYWYARTHEDGHESIAYVPAEAVAWNVDLPASLWSTRTLRKIR